MSGSMLLSRLGSERKSFGHDQVARVLGTEILAGVYPPGANMPSEAELLARFEVSRPLLREVMKTLAAKGLLIPKARVGTRVRDPADWNFFDAEVLWWMAAVEGMDAIFRRHLVEIRRAIEPHGAALAAERATDDDVAELRRAIAAVRRDSHTRRSFAEADLQFHRAVGAISKNPLMRSMAAVVEAALSASFFSSPSADRLARQDAMADARERLVDAIAARDAEAASTAMLDLIDLDADHIEGEEGASERPPPAA